MSYPDDWPMCPVCGELALDGHITCGKAQCNEGEQRRKRDAEYFLGKGTPAETTVGFAKLFASIGAPMWSDDLLGKLMAFATATGYPPCTAQRPMFDVLMVAADRFNIKSGAKPNQQLMKEHYLPRLKEIKELKAETPWLPQLMERYHVQDWQYFDYGWAEDIKT